MHRGLLTPVGTVSGPKSRCNGPRYLCEHFGVIVVRDLYAAVSEKRGPHLKGTLQLARWHVPVSPGLQPVEDVSTRRREPLHAANTHVEDAGADKDFSRCARSGQILMSGAKRILPPSQPSCIISAASAGRVVHGQLACVGHTRTTNLARQSRPLQS